MCIIYIETDKFKRIPFFARSYQYFIPKYYLSHENLFRLQSEYKVYIEKYHRKLRNSIHFEGNCEPEKYLFVKDSKYEAFGKELSFLFSYLRPQNKNFTFLDYYILKKYVVSRFNVGDDEVVVLAFNIEDTSEETSEEIVNCNGSSVSKMKFINLITKYYTSQFERPKEEDKNIYIYMNYPSGLHYIPLFSYIGIETVLNDEQSINIYKVVNVDDKYLYVKLIHNETHEIENANCMVPQNIHLVGKSITLPSGEEVRFRKLLIDRNVLIIDGEKIRLRFTTPFAGLVIT